MKTRKGSWMAPKRGLIPSEDPLPAFQAGQVDGLGEHSWLRLKHLPVHPPREGLAGMPQEATRWGWPLSYCGHWSSPLTPQSLCGLHQPWA